MIDMAEKVSLMQLAVDEARAANDPAPAEQLSAERLRVRERISWLCRHAGDGRANGLLRSVVEQYRMGGLP